MDLPRSAGPVRPSYDVFVLLGLVFALLAPSAATAAEDGLTLQEAVSRGLREGYGAKIARLLTGQAEDGYREMRGAYLPHVYVSSGAGFSNRREQKLVALDENFEVKEYGLAALASDQGWLNFVVEQQVFDATQWKNMEREKLAAEAARISENDERERVAHQVTGQFAEIVRLQRLADQATLQVEDARWLDKQAAALLEAGRALQADREFVGLHLAEAEMEATARKAEARNALSTLWGSISGGEETAAPLRVADRLPETDQISAAAAEEAVVSAPDVRVLELRRRMEEANVGAASARRLPTLGLRAGYSHYGADRFDLFKDEWRVGIDLRVPIFDGFEAKSAIAGAVKGVEIARLRYHSLLESKRNRVRELMRKLDAADQRLQLARRRAVSSRERQRLTDLRMQSERATVDEALSARERSVRDAREATNSYFTRFEVWTALQHEMGRLSAAVLGSRGAP